MRWVYFFSNDKNDDVVLELPSDLYKKKNNQSTFIVDVN